MSELNEQTAQMEDQETSTGTGEDKAEPEKAEPEKAETNQAESSANKASEETGDDQDAPEEEKADGQPEGSEAPEEKADSVKTAEQQKKEDDEKYMRLMAEFQNYKKRVAKEKQDIQSFANEKIITELLEVLDNFERSLEHSSDADENYVKGMEMIFQQLFGFGHGNGYPKDRVVPEQRNKKILDGVKKVTYRPLLDMLKDVDQEFVKETISGKHFAEYFYRDSKDEAIKAYLKELH